MASTKTETTTLPPQKYGKIVLTLENVLIPSEKLSPSPSCLDGLDAETEFDLRVLGCEMIQTSGILLRLPQVAMACGQVLFQRLYYAKSLVRYPMEATAMACVALASKIEEAPRKIRDVINVFRHIRQVKNGKTLSPVILDANYISLKNQVIKAERRLLKELGFCCHVKHPHKMIIMYLRLVEADDNRNLAKSSWNYMNDALRTDVFMRYSPESIACSCIWLAARKLRVPLPENPPWYHVVDVDIDDIHHIAASVLKLYTRLKVKLEVLEAKVEEIRKQQQEARLRNKFLPPHQQTPLQAVGSTFSPGSPRHNSSTTGVGGTSSTTNAGAAKPGVASVTASRKDAGGHQHRSGSDDSQSSGSRRSRSNHHSPGGRPHKKARRSDSRDVSRSRSRGRSRDRHHSSKKHSHSRTASPDITPPPRFTKNKDKGPIVRSNSRSRSRTPIRSYDKYDRQEKYDRSSDKYSSNKYDRKDKYSDKYASDKYPAKNDKYSSDAKYDSYDKVDKHSEKVDKYSDKNNKQDRNDKYVEKGDRYKYEKTSKYPEKYDQINDKYGKEEKLPFSAKYNDIDSKDKSLKYDKYDKVDKYDKLEKYDKVDKLDKYEKVDKYAKYDNIEKKRSHDSKKLVDNGYEKYDKVHKSKKSRTHRSRSRDRRR